MFLKRLQLINFKNYEEEVFDFSDKVTCLVGDNGAGKTNVLDAVYYLSSCKSYFNSIDSQNIMYDKDAFSIMGKYQVGETGKDAVQCVMQRNQRKVFRYNNKEYNKLSDHIGKLPCVMISPYDTNLIDAGSDERRKYIDIVISQYDKLYLDDLIQYNKALAQRNTYLKQLYDSGKNDDVLISLWDDQLVKFGNRIFEKRRKFIDEFILVFNSFYQLISPDDEHVSVEYESQLLNTPLDELLRNSLEKDRILRYTACGIHKDDLSFTLSGMPIKKYGSQGQQKSLIVALKLAQFEFIYLIKGFKPILLLDDIFDKLDRSRVEKLMELVSHERFGQIIITDTNIERVNFIFKEINKAIQIFSINKGKIE